MIGTGAGAAVITGAAVAAVAIGEVVATGDIIIGVAVAPLRLSTSNGTHNTKNT